MGQIFLCSLDEWENVILIVFLIFSIAFFIKKLPAHTKVETKLVSLIYFERVRGSEGWDPRGRETPPFTPPFPILRYVLFHGYQTSLRV